MLPIGILEGLFEAELVEKSALIIPDIAANGQVFFTGAGIETVYGLTETGIAATVAAGTTIGGTTLGGIVAGIVNSLNTNTH